MYGSNFAEGRSLGELGFVMKKNPILLSKIDEIMETAGFFPKSLGVHPECP
jgi:hypothetical protein